MLRIKDKLKEWRYLPGLSKAWIGLLLKLTTYPLDYYLHNSTFITLPLEAKMTSNSNKRPSFWDSSEELTAMYGGYRLEIT